MKKTFIAVFFACCIFCLLISCDLLSSGDSSFSSLAITSLPYKTEYEVGDELDLSGIVVEGITTSGSHQKITNFTSFPNNGTILSGIGIWEVTISYGKVSTSFKICVYQKGEKRHPISIKVLTSPTKLDYIENEFFSIDGMSIGITYSDGLYVTKTDGFSVDSEKIKIFTPITKANAGITTFNVSYSENITTLSTKFICTINAYSLSNFELLRGYQFGWDPTLREQLEKLDKNIATKTTTVTFFNHITETDFPTYVNLDQELKGFVKGYLSGTDLYIVGQEICFSSDSSDAFKGFCNVTNFNNIEIVKFGSNGISSTRSMFAGCSSITSLHLSNFFGSPNPYYMFSNCTSLKTIYLRGYYDVDKATIFTNCPSLTKIYCASKDAGTKLTSAECGLSGTWEWDASDKSMNKVL